MPNWVFIRTEEGPDTDFIVAAYRASLKKNGLEATERQFLKEIKQWVEKAAVIKENFSEEFVAQLTSIYETSLNLLIDEQISAEFSEQMGELSGIRYQIFNEVFAGIALGNHCQRLLYGNAKGKVFSRLTTELLGYTRFFTEKCKRNVN